MRRGGVYIYMRGSPGRGAQYRSKMRAVGMLRTGFILVFLIIAYASTLPLQFLPPIPGYVPVYIRNGDEPLEDINLALAEAFAEHSSSKILKESNVILEVQQPVDYELISDAHDQGNNKSILDVFEPEKESEEQNDDVDVETLHLDDAVTPMQRRDTNRSNVQKKSEAVTLEVNRSRIPQLLTAQEREDEQLSNSETKTEKPNPISVSKEATIEVSSVQADEKDDLEKLAAEVEKSDFKPNEVIDPNPNYPELPAEIPQQHNSQDFGPLADVPQDVGSVIMSLQEGSQVASESDESSSSSSSSSEESVESNGSNVSVSSESKESE